MAVEISASTGALYPGLPPAPACSAAVADGFTAVEFWAIPEHEVRDVEQVVTSAGLAVTSINAGTGEAPDDFGLLGIPDALTAWRQAFLDSLDVARRLHARGINLLVGGRVTGSTRSAQLECVRRNLDWCLTRLAPGDPVLLIEPLNGADRRSPLVRSVADAAAVLDSVGSPPELGMLFDAYHLFQEEPDLHEAFDRARPRHVQLADHPGRGEPGTGTLPVADFVRHVLASGYDGWLGCEFTPSGPGAVAPARQALAGMLTRVEAAS